jgi:hypothetical protein
LSGTDDRVRFLVIQRLCRQAAVCFTSFAAVVVADNNEAQALC